MQAAPAASAAQNLPRWLAVVWAPLRSPQPHPTPALYLRVPRAGSALPASGWAVGPVGADQARQAHLSWCLNLCIAHRRILGHGRPARPAVGSIRPPKQPVHAQHGCWHLQQPLTCSAGTSQPLLPLTRRRWVACRAETHRHVLQAATQELLARIDRMQSDRLLQLLEVSSCRCAAPAIARRLVCKRLHPAGQCCLQANGEEASVCTSAAGQALLGHRRARGLVQHSSASYHSAPVGCFHCCRRHPFPTLGLPTCAPSRWRCCRGCSPCLRLSSSSWPRTGTSSGTCLWGCSARWGEIGRGGMEA